MISKAKYRYRSFKNTLAQYPEVQSVTASHLVPGDEYIWTVGIQRLPDQGNSHTIFLNAVDPSFVPHYGMEILAGRNFYPEERENSNTIMLSEAACRMLGYTRYEDILGQRYRLLGDTFNVVGVMSDYQQWGLQQETGAYAFIQRPEEARRYAIKMSGGKPEQQIALAREAYNDTFEDGVFEYFFLDKHFDRQYRADRQFGWIVSIFAGLAIFVACLGLLGLSLFMALQRAKEIGIRKVLGATTASIVGLLSRDFLKLVLWAVILAVPLAWWSMYHWLQDFAHRVELQWWFFALASLGALLMALLTVSYQSIRAARRNPAEALKNE